MAFFGQESGFLVMVAPEPLIISLQNTAKRALLTPGEYGALPVTTQAPETLFQAKNWLFLAIFGQKMRFFGDGGAEPLDYLLPNLAKRFSLSPAP